MCVRYLVNNLKNSKNVQRTKIEISKWKYFAKSLNFLLSSWNYTPKLLADFSCMTSKHTKKGHLIKFFFRERARKSNILLSILAFCMWALKRRSSMSRISSYRRPKLAWNVLIYFPPFCFYHIIRVILMLKKNPQVIKLHSKNRRAYYNKKVPQK